MPDSPAPTDATPQDVCPGTLTYEVAPPTSRKLSLRREGDTVVITFPTQPTWAWFAAMAMQISVGLLKLCFAAAIAYQFHRLARFGPLSPDVTANVRRFEISTCLFGAGSAAVWWAMAAHTWWTYRRGAAGPKKLTATADGLVLRRFLWNRMRDKLWPASDVSQIEIRIVKGNLNWRRTAADLYVRLRTRRPLRFRLSSSDPEIPRQIAAALSAVLQKPLATR